MGEETSREATKKYFKQICVAVAVLLVLYGVVQLLTLLSDLTNVYISYNWWIFFQIIVAILIIFIGLRVYLMAKKIKFVNLSQFWGATRLQFLVLFLALLSVAPFVLYPMPASSSLYPQLFQHYSVHIPISFAYKIDYRWKLGSGGSVLMYTAYDYPCFNVAILVDVIPIKGGFGWIVVPYEIYRPEVALPAFGPARTEIELGMIENGNYILKIVMSNTIDIFEVHKTENKFWIEEIRVKQGAVIQKSEFEKRLDGFRVDFIGYPNIDNETKNLVFNRIEEMGGMIIDTKSYFDGWSVDVYFYYAGDLTELSQIIIEVAKNHPEYWIRISSNTGWLVQVSQYNFVIVVRRPENADSVINLILRKSFWIFKQEKEQFLEWKDSIKLYCSSAPLKKVWAEFREDLIKSMSQELGLKHWEDFWVSY